MSSCRKKTTNMRRTCDPVKPRCPQAVCGPCCPQSCHASEPPYACRASKVSTKRTYPSDSDEITANNSRGSERHAVGKSKLAPASANTDDKAKPEKSFSNESRRMGVEDSRKTDSPDSTNQRAQKSKSNIENNVLNDSKGSGHSDNGKLNSTRMQDLQKTSRSNSIGSESINNAKRYSISLSSKRPSKKAYHSTRPSSNAVEKSSNEPQISSCYDSTADISDIRKDTLHFSDKKASNDSTIDKFNKPDATLSTKEKDLQKSVDQNDPTSAQKPSNINSKMHNLISAEPENNERAKTYQNFDQLNISKNESEIGPNEIKKERIAGNNISSNAIKSSVAKLNPEDVNISQLGTIEEANADVVDEPNDNETQSIIEKTVTPNMEIFAAINQEQNKSRGFDDKNGETNRDSVKSLISLQDETPKTRHSPRAIQKEHSKDSYKTRGKASTGRNGPFRHHYLDQGRYRLQQKRHASIDERLLGDKNRSMPGEGGSFNLYERFSKMEGYKYGYVDSVKALEMLDRNAVNYNIYIFLSQREVERELLPFEARRCIDKALGTTPSEEWLVRHRILNTKDRRLSKVELTTGCKIELGDLIGTENCFRGLPRRRLDITGPSYAHITNAINMMEQYFPKLMRNAAYPFPLPRETTTKFETEDRFATTNVQTVDHEPGNIGLRAVLNDRRLLTCRQASEAYENA